MPRCTSASEQILSFDVDHGLGKGEVVGSIPTGSTSRSANGLRGFQAGREPKLAQIFSGCPQERFALRGYRASTAHVFENWHVVSEVCL